MKKLFLTVGLIAMSGAAFAQGYINFNATGNPTVYTNISDPLLGGPTGGPTMTAPGNYYYALLVSPYKWLRLNGHRCLGRELVTCYVNYRRLRYIEQQCCSWQNLRRRFRNSSGRLGRRHLQ